VAERVPQSWAWLSEAIGDCRLPLADRLGMKRATIDKRCLPPPGFGAADRHSDGRTNPIDFLAAIFKHCPDGPHAVEQLLLHLADPEHSRRQAELLAIITSVAARLGHRIVPEVDTPGGGALFRGRPNVVLAGAEKLVKELNRPRTGHETKLTVEETRALHAEVREGFDILVADYLERRTLKGCQR